MISPKQIRIFTYAIFVCVIIDLTESYVKAILNTVAVFNSGFLLSCLYAHFNSLPAAKQTILVHSTKLLILTNHFANLRSLLGPWLRIFKHLIEPWAAENFLLFCTMINLNWFVLPVLSTLIIQLGLKICLIVAPVKFLNLNTHLNRAVLSLIPASALLYQLVYAIAKGGTCSNVAILEIEERLYLNMSLPRTDELKEHEPFQIIPKLLVVVFLIEVASRILDHFRKIGQNSKEKKLSKHGNQNIERNPETDNFSDVGNDETSKNMKSICQNTVADIFVISNLPNRNTGKQINTNKALLPSSSKSTAVFLVKEESSQNDLNLKENKQILHKQTHDQTQARPKEQEQTAEQAQLFKSPSTSFELGNKQV